MSYQQPPEQRAGIPAGPPPGWYPDPAGLRALRWWDGAQWSQYAQPLPGAVQDPQPAYLGTAGAASSGEFLQERIGRHRQQGGPQDGMYQQGIASDPSPAPFPPGQLQQPDQYQPQGWPLQQASVPGPHPRGHRAPRRPTNRKARRVLICLGASAMIIGAASVAATHGLSSSRETAATSAAASSANSSPSSQANFSSPSVAASSPPSCYSQLLTWRSDGTESQLQAISTDLSSVSQSAGSLGSDLSLGADSSADEAALQSAAASLQSDTQAAQDNLVPDCVPGAHQAESAGLADFNNSAVDCENAISEIGSGNSAVATGDLHAANAAMQSGTAEIQRTTADLQKYAPS